MEARAAQIQHQGPCHNILKIVRLPLSITCTLHQHSKVLHLAFVHPSSSSRTDTSRVECLPRNRCYAAQFEHSDLGTLRVARFVLAALARHMFVRIFWLKHREARTNSENRSLASQSNSRVHIDSLL